MMQDEFAGTMFTSSEDEDVRPASTPHDLYPFKGSYAVSVECVRLVRANTPKEARAAFKQQLADARVAPTLDVRRHAIHATGIDAGIVERATDKFRLGDVPSFVFFDAHKDEEVRGELAKFCNTLVDNNCLPEPDAPATSDDAPQYAIRYDLVFSCARQLWARDADHATARLTEDVAVLLTPDSLDRWKDETVNINWELHRCTKVKQPAKETTA